MNQLERQIEMLEKEVRWLRRQLANVPIRVTPGGGGGDQGERPIITDAIKIEHYADLAASEYASLPAGVIAYIGETDYSSISGIFIKTEGMAAGDHGMWRAVTPVMAADYETLISEFGDVPQPAIGFQTTEGQYYVKIGTGWYVMRHSTYSEL